MKALSRTARILSGAVLTLFGLLLATFLIARVVPIDPAIAILGDRASPSSYAAVRKELGLDRPLYVQFGRYVGERRARRFRPLGADQEPGDTGHRAFLSRRPSSSRPRRRCSACCSACRRA